MFLVKWVPIFSKQTWILAKSSHFIESPFSLEHKISRKKRSDRHFRCFCGEFCTLSVNHFHFTESPFYREKIAADFVQKFPFYRIPILSRMYCISNDFSVSLGSAQNSNAKLEHWGIEHRALMNSLTSACHRALKIFT